jgi:thiol-disulfide isomerase/thioredoxin
VPSRPEPHADGIRVRAPELNASGTWLNTPQPLSLASLRGRFVLLDFWTSCCGNCLHVLDELRAFEARRREVVTVIGVHSPKFPHEAEPAAVAAAIERNEIEHPVVNDPQLRLWRQYAVKAWPTLVLIDPEGYIVAQAAGEGQVSALEAVLVRLSPEYAERGSLRPGHPIATDSVTHTRSALRYPAKAIRLPAARTGRGQDSILVADAGRHRLVEFAADLTVVRDIGSGQRGNSDGPAGSARFAEPNGLALLPAGIAPYDVLVADTANHVLRGVRLSDGATVATIDLAAALAGTTTITGSVPAVLSPWDVAWWPAQRCAVVAAAGVHLLLGFDPVTGEVSILAGNTVEGLRDGTAQDAWLAQPSGLAVDEDRVWFVDAETSALRYLTRRAQVHTVVGAGLFDFGHVDGPGERARMQHPLAVLIAEDGSVIVFDTYNGAVRQWDEQAGRMTTMATSLAEPSGGVVIDGRLLVVESAAHRLLEVDRTVRLPEDPVDVDPEVAEVPVEGAAQQVRRPPAAIAAGRVLLRVRFLPPPGRKLDDRYGPAQWLEVSASPPNLLRAGAGGSGELFRELLVADDVPHGVLHVTASAASCDDDGTQHPACYLARQDWGLPVQVSPDGPKVLEIVLFG